MQRGGLRSPDSRDPRHPTSPFVGPPIAESLFATAPEPGRSASLVASSTLRPTPPKMDRAILSYSPPLERAILRRLTRAPLGGIMRQSAPNFVGWSDRLPPLERQKGEEAGDTSSRRRPFLHGARMMRSTTADAAEVVGGDRERQHNRERHSLLARVTKANPSGCCDRASD